MKILLVEAEPQFATLIKKDIEEKGHRVETVLDEMEGKRLVQINNYDVIIIDLLLPHINGIELCSEIRSKNIKSPILIISDLGSIDDKIKGFEAGADDYLVKPFEFPELFARIKALHKRSICMLPCEEVLSVADLELNLEKKIVTRSGKFIDLTLKEFTLLEYFLRNKGKVIPRSIIAENVWGIHFDSGTNIVDVYVNFLRKKIENKKASRLLHTVIGIGYILKEEQFI